MASTGIIFCAPCKYILFPLVTPAEIRSPPLGLEPGLGGFRKRCFDILVDLPGGFACIDSDVESSLAVIVDQGLGGAMIRLQTLLQSFRVVV